ncbi:hypothetical protein ACFPRL_01320 [Pseudoclavibacter helvolus]
MRIGSRTCTGCFANIRGIRQRSEETSLMQHLHMNHHPGLRGYADQGDDKLSPCGQSSGRGGLWCRLRLLCLRFFGVLIVVC